MLSKLNIAGRIIQWLLIATIACGDVYLVVANTRLHSNSVQAMVSEVQSTLPESSAPVSSEEERVLSGRYALYAEQIKTACGNSGAVKNIISHIEDYPEELLDTLISKPEMINFVNGYPSSTQYGFGNSTNIDVSEDYIPGKIPLFMQWDSRWGYETYGSNRMAFTACGPTCFAMVYVGLTGDTSVNPLTIAKMSIQNGYYIYGSGTGGDLFSNGVYKYDLDSKRLSFDKNTVLESLDTGRPVVISVGPGDFTSTGHYIVLTGIADNGEVFVNDPNSYRNSRQTWDLDRIIGQAKVMWSVWKL